jgi:hypothetical protein
MTDLAARLKAKGYARTSSPAFLKDFGVQSFSLDDEILVNSVSIKDGTYIVERHKDGIDTETDDNDA